MEMPTEPMWDRATPPFPQSGGTEGFGPAGHADEERAVAGATEASPDSEAVEPTTVRRYRRAGAPGWDPGWSPARREPSGGNPFFDLDVPTIGPVIGE